MIQRKWNSTGEGRQYQMSVRSSELKLVLKVGRTLVSVYNFYCFHLFNQQIRSHHQVMAHTSTNSHVAVRKALSTYLSKFK